jgi:glycosyltransferase involved in cell wall biosynthesis
VRILHVAETAKGGVGSCLDELIPLQIAAVGAGNVRAIIPAQDRTQLPSVSDADLMLFRRKKRSALALLDLARRLRGELREFQPNILHLHSTFAGAIGRIAASRGPKCKIIYNPHGWAFEMWPSGLKRRSAALAERLLARRCDGILAVSNAERRQGLAEGLPAEKIFVVVSGISPTIPRADSAEWNDERLKVLFVGRLDRQKGFDTLVEIAPRQIDKLALRVVGVPVVSKSSIELSGPNIEHLGWLERNDVDAQLRACDILAMPSRWEALGITALEAMRAGKPVVAFAVGGLAEVVDDGVTGRLVPAGDSMAFERALLSESREGWQRMGAAARHRFDALFTSARMADQIFESYDSV